MSLSRKTFPVYNSNGSLATGASVKVYVTGETPALHPSGQWSATEVGSSGVFYVDLDNGVFDIYINGLLFAHNTNRWVGGTDIPDKATDETISGTWQFSAAILPGTADAGLVNATSITVHSAINLGVAATLFGYGQSLVNVDQGKFYGQVYALAGTFGTIYNLPTGTTSAAGSVFGEILVGTKKVFGTNDIYGATELYSQVGSYATFNQEFPVGSMFGDPAQQGITIEHNVLQHATKYRLFRFDGTVDITAGVPGTLQRTELRIGVWGGTYDTNGNQYVYATTMVGNGRWNEIMFLGSSQARVNAESFKIGTREDSVWLSFTRDQWSDATINSYNQLTLTAGNGASWVKFPSAVEFSKGEVYSKGYFSATEFSANTKYILGSSLTEQATSYVVSSSHIGTFTKTYQFSGDIALTVPRGVNVHGIMRAGTVEAEYLLMKATTSMDFNTLDTFSYKLGYTAAATQNIEIGDVGAYVKIQNEDVSVIGTTYIGIGTFGTIYNLPSSGGGSVFQEIYVATQAFFGAAYPDLRRSYIVATEDTTYPTMAFVVPTSGVSITKHGTFLFLGATAGTVIEMGKFSLDHIGTFIYATFSVRGNTGGGVIQTDRLEHYRGIYKESSGGTTQADIMFSGTRLLFFLDGTRAGELDPTIGWVNG